MSHHVSHPYKTILIFCFLDLPNASFLTSVVSKLVGWLLRRSLCPAFHLISSNLLSSHISELGPSSICVVYLSLSLLPLIFISKCFCYSMLIHFLTFFQSTYLDLVLYLLQLELPLTNVFLILSRLVFPTNVFRNFISAVCGLHSSQNGMLMSMYFFKYILNIVILHFLSVSLFHNKLIAMWYNFESFSVLSFSSCLFFQPCFQSKYNFLKFFLSLLFSLLYFILHCSRGLTLLSTLILFPVHVPLLCGI